jgi:ketosteroid isomerase-like protein
VGADAVDVARRVYDAINRGDISGALKHVDPDVEWRMSPSFARDQRVFRGHDGVREALAIFGESLDEIRADPDDVLDAGDAAVAPATISGRLRGSGERMAYELVQVWSVRDGLVTRLDVYESVDEAWDALGTSPPSPSSASISDDGTGRDSR